MIKKETVLQFDFDLIEEAEGHAVCIDEDLSDETFGGVEIRCWVLGGSEFDDWQTANHIEQRVLSGTKRTFSIDVGKHFASKATEINYIAFIQDNDLNPSIGKATFSNIALGSSSNQRALVSSHHFRIQSLFFVSDL